MVFTVCTCLPWSINHGHLIIMCYVTLEIICIYVCALITGGSLNYEIATDGHCQPVYFYLYLIVGKCTTCILLW